MKYQLFFTIGVGLVVIILMLFFENFNTCEGESKSCTHETNTFEELIRKVNREERHEAKTEELLLIMKDIQKQIQESVDSKSKEQN